MNSTIRWRIGIPFALLLVFTTLGLSIYYNQLARTTYEENLKDRLTADARLLADAVVPSLGDPVNFQELNKIAHQYADRLGLRVTIIRKDGVVIGESDADQLTMDNHLTRPEIKEAISGEESAHSRFSATVHKNFMYVAVPIRAGGEILGAARLAVSLDQVENIPNQISRTISTLTILLVLVTLILAAIVTEITLHPLRALTSAVQKVSAGEFSGPLLPTTRDEIGQLNHAFNQMSIQLQAQIEALQKERGKLAAVLAHMTDGVLIVDGEGVVQLINPAAERLFQVNESAALGHSLVEVVRHHQLVEVWSHSRRTGEQEATTLEISAERLYLQCVATPLIPTLPDNTLLLFQDLTRVRRLETVRQDFISNVSHELRTPLAALKALTETLQESALEDPPAAQRFLQRMEVEIDTLSQMVQELLELSRIESGKVPIKRKNVAPQVLLGLAVERMRLQAERAGLTLRLECPPDLPAISADQDRVEQVLINLLHNAIKFTLPGGVITVSAEHSESFVVFQVKDSGVGIPDKDLPRIFERFYKADRARSSGGTGLGLSIARHIVEGHGGQIWAESQINRGSQFFFSIPAAQ